MPSIGSKLDSDVKRVMMWVGFVTLIVSVTTAFVATEAQISSKADKSTVDSLNRGVQALLIFACRDPRNERDTFCAGVPK